jgi:hypothetical protein
MVDTGLKNIFINFINHEAGFLDLRSTAAQGRPKRPKFLPQNPKTIFAWLSLHNWPSPHVSRLVKPYCLQISSKLDGPLTSINPPQLFKLFRDHASRKAYIIFQRGTRHETPATIGSLLGCSLVNQ